MCDINSTGYPEIGHFVDYCFNGWFKEDDSYYSRDFTHHSRYSPTF